MATRTRHLPGEQGVWVVILGELTIFAAFFGAFVWARGEDPELFLSSQQHLDQSRAVLNTLLLLTSSLCVAGAVKAIRKGASTRGRPLLMAAVIGGAGFWLVKLVEYGELLGDRLSPATNDFFMYYFVLTWLHLLHLLVGMAVLLFLWSLAGRGELTARQVSYVEGGGCYWHMVDVVWIGLFSLLYLPATLAAAAFACLKVRLVGLYLMELRAAPVPLRVLFEGWVVATCAVLIVLYLSGA